MKPAVALTLALLVGLLPAQDNHNRAALVVRFADGTVERRCVTFPETSITGEELLRRSGLDVLITVEGAVCSIGGYGCPANNCFCRCTYPECEYWAYYHWTDGAWTYSQVGARLFPVTDGALEGWSWGPGDYGTSGTAPPPVAFADVCLPATATPTPSATLRASATPTVSALPLAAPVELPGAMLETETISLNPGECTVLKWLVWGTDSVTLDGKPVAPQDREEICPAASRRYVLVATNSAGQTTRELTVQVRATPSPVPPTATWTLTPPVRGTEGPVPSGAEGIQGTVPLVPTESPLVQPADPEKHALEGAEGTGRTEEPALNAVKGTGGTAAPTQPLPQPSPARGGGPGVGIGTPTVGRVARARTAGRPTSAPVLVARQPSPRVGDAEVTPEPEAPRELSTPDRGFQPTYLPQYAAYSLMVALLLGAVGRVMRQRNEP